VRLIEAIILGLVQGLTEFLPISSSGHLRILGEFLPSAIHPGATFTAITQIGTEAAVLVYFWRDISRIIRRWFGSLAGSVPTTDPDVRMGWLIIIGTIPIVLVGYFAQEYIRSGPGRDFGRNCRRFCRRSCRHRLPDELHLQA